MNDTLNLVLVLLAGCGLLSVVIVKINSLIKNRLPKLFNLFTSDKCPHCPEGVLYHDKTIVNAAEMDCYVCDTCNTEFI
ncbi:hypothetical protein M1M25_gp107 [Tenacibaculum phage Gundel_1]|uniref:Uncharacterized protein n=1 Tax=Tenacibaculum phage Gundel_1 TaxID=2745672 RepID=A0A8E5EBK0_9CAUD|nr:hypothetical protein M1M25_gp107 [Tenacibaculum phage Gundel_1]QQV91434.1 hypothetical protein Gundel1_111 [Tenacibaculum phage Gundel_1]